MVMLSAVAVTLSHTTFWVVSLSVVQPGFNPSELPAALT
jgi:hypothetical protein